jgi:hypothetical protein
VNVYGMGYLTPTLFTFSRALDRERLARLPGATLTGSSVSFSHVESAQPGLDAARLLQGGLPKRAGAPTVSGHTDTAAAASQVPPQRSWDERSFLDAALACRPEREVALMQELIAHVHALNGTLSWGKHATPGVSGRYSVAGASTPVWIMRVISDARASSARFELTAKWIAPRLAASGQGFGRLEAAAHALRKIPHTAGKIDIKKASEQDWKTDFKITFSDIAEGDGHIQDVLDAVNVIVDADPSSG